ncbi:phosphate ABC transporter substrate-binding protein PstS family protein [Parvibaculum sp.]|uniref:PstS family phosphate ABC transporter substrate-binding protein n=1 Tax=Parvibaculum sp. TaxID=2024848 RepID=UPI00320CE9E2
MKRIKALLGALAVTLTATSAFAMDIDSRYQPYQPTTGVSGSLKSIGSDTLNNLMTLWAEGYKAQYPAVKIEIEGKGSSTAPPALIAGTSQFGPMSRPMKAAEIDAFEQKYGYKPTQVRVAVDTLAVYVNKDNPLTCISLTQIDGVFSKSRLSGSPDITTWGQLGLTGEWASKPISLFGRNSASGTYGYFKEVTLVNGDYKDSVKEQPGSSAVVQGVAADKFAMGYSGIGYKTADVKAVPVAGRDGQCQEANQKNAYTGAYPITRFLYVYVNKNPSTALDPLRGEFFRFVLSLDGQKDTSKDGYYPMPYIFAQQELAKLGLK